MQLQMEQFFFDVLFVMVEAQKIMSSVLILNL